MRTILAIDDQQDNLTTLEALVKNFVPNCRVITARSGKNGIEISEKEQPDTILLDVIMPVMDGYKVCAKLKKNSLTKHIPIILISSSQIDLESRMKGMDCGADAYLSKPIQANELAAQIKVMLRIKKAEDKLKKERDELEKLVLKRTSKLKESEEKYKILYENAPLPYQSLNEDGSFKDINPAWLTTLGYARDEVIGKFYKDFLHPDWQKHFEVNFPAFKKRGYVNNVQFKIRHKKGHYIDISFEGCIGYHPDGSFKQTYCVFQDITFQKQAENSLLKNQYYLGKAQEMGNIGTWELDLTLNKLVWTEENYKIFGIPFGTEMTYELFLNCVHPDDRELVNNKWRAALDKQPYDIEHRLLLENKIKWVRQKAELEFDEDGNAIKAIGFTQDITERKLAEISRIKNKERFENIVENTSAGYFFIDKDGIIKSVNNAWVKLYKYDNKEEIINHHFAEIQKIADLELAKKVVTEIMNGNPDYMTGEFSRQCKDGSIGYHSFSSTPVYDQSEMIGIEGFIIDTTEKKKAEKKTRAIEENLKSTFDLSPSLICKANLNTGYFIEVNQAVTKILGYSIEEFISKPISEFIHPDDQQKSTDEGDGQLEGMEVTFFENRYLCKDGSYKWLAWYGTQADENGIVTVIGSDINEHKQAELQLNQSTQLLNASQSIAKLGGWELDISTNNLFWTAETYRIHETSPEEFNPTVDAGVGYFLPESRCIISNALELAIKDGKGYDLELETYTTKGNRIHVRTTCEVTLQDGQPIKLTGIFQDITEQKKAEEALRQSEATIRKKLKIITEPEGDIGNLELSDIIDTEVLQSMMEDFYQLTGMLGAILDISGKVLVAVGWQDICTKFHRCNPDSLKNCIESDTCLTQGVPEGTFKSYHCKNNMWDIVTPIIVGGRHLGNVFMGQYLLEDEVPDVEFFRKQAKKYGFNEAAYLAALDRVPRFSQETVDVGMQFYSKLAGVVSKLSYGSIQQSRMLNELKQTELNLIKAKEKAEDSERKLKTALESMSDAIFISDQEGNFIDFNEAFAVFHKFATKEECAKTLKDYPVILDVYNPEGELLPVEKWVVSRALRGETGLNREYILKRKDTNETWVGSYNYSPIRNNEGDIVGSVVTARDITEQKKVEQAIKESRNYLERVTDSIWDAVFTVKYPERVIEWANDSYRILGYDLNEYIGKTSEFLYPDKNSFVNFGKRLSAACENNEDILQTEVVLKRKNGEKFPADIATTIFRDKGVVKNITSVVRDITERKRNEIELRNSEDRFHELFNSMSNGVCIFKVVNKGKDFVFFDVNKAGEQIILAQKNTLIGKSIYTVRPNADVHGLTAVFKRVWETGMPEAHDEKFYKDGQLRRYIKNFVYKLKTGEIVRIFEDLTEQKKSIRLISESKERFDLAMKASKDGLYDWNLVDNTIYYSPGWKKMLGYEDDELPNDFTIWENLTEPEHVKRSWVMQNELINKTRDRFEMEFKMKHKNGHFVDILSRAEAHFNADGKAIRIVGTHTDITESKSIKTALEKNEKLLNMTSEIAKVGGWDIDVESNTLIWTKETYLIHEVSPDFQPTVEKAINFYTKDSKIIIEKTLNNSINSGQPFDLELNINTAKGNTKIVNAIGQIQQGNKGEVIRVHGIFQDITERKGVELAMLAKEEQKQTILKTALDGFFIVDDKGKFIEVNTAFSTMIGTSGQELMTMRIFDVSYLSAKDAFGRMKKTVRSGNEKFESKFIRKDGSMIDVEISVQYQAVSKGQFVCFIHDITQRKYSEREQKLTELRLDAQVKLNQMTGKPLDEIYNYTLKKAIELTNSKIGFLGFVNADETMVTIYNWLGIVKDECEVEDVNIEFEVEKSGIWGEVIRKRDVLLINDFDAPNPLKRGVPEGHVKIENYLSIPVFSENKIVAVVAVSNKEGDYNEADIKRLTLLLNSMWNFVVKHKTQNDLKIAKEKAEESDRLKSAFLANMSHEIRTPMNGILGFTSLLKEPGLTGETQTQYINIIQKSGNRMLNTVNDIIEISRIETGQVILLPKEININLELESLYNFFKLEVENKGMQLFLEKDLSAEEAIVITDESKLSSILTNLIKNAIKYSKQGSIKIACKKKGEQLEFTVKDTGMGIPKERQDAIFERFIQADIDDREVYEGSGLGLAISKTYVEMLGGKIWVESGKGEGSTFCFTIDYNPVETVKSKEKDTKADLKNDDLPENLILVAEDDDVSFLLVQNILSENCSLIRAKNGKEAVKICENTSGIRLILMDLKMPVLGGIEAAKLIRKFNAEVPIIAQTAYALSGDRQIAMNAGCNDYITKPLNRKKLIPLINSYLKPVNN